MKLCWEKAKFFQSAKSFRLQKNLSPRKMFGLSWKKKIIDYALKDYAKSYDFEDSGFFTSQLTIKNVELNSSCLDNFSTPFTLKRGIIGNLELTVPWGNLTKEAIQATIRDVHIILEYLHVFQTKNNWQNNLTTSRIFH